MSIRTRARCTLAGFLSLSLAIGQQSGGSVLSAPVAKLLRKPRVGEATITMRDGQVQTGRIVRVTDRFIALITETPLVCADVELSAVESVKWQPEKGQGNPVLQSLEMGLIMVVLAPAFAVSVIADPFERLSPPLKPLSDSWAARDSKLEFSGNTVKYQKITRKRGHWSVETNRLHLVVEGEPETVIPFHFDCAALYLDDRAAKLSAGGQPPHASPPIVGDWFQQGTRLSIRPDGTFAEEDTETRDGTFTNTATSLTIRWNTPTGPGGTEWVAPIHHRHIVLSIGCVTTQYHYVPHDPDIGL